MVEIKKPNNLVDLGLQETEMQKWKERFETFPDEARFPHSAKSTCSLYLDGKESILYVTPKKLGTSIISWDFARDIQAHWSHHASTLYAIMLLMLLILFLMYWQFFPSFLKIVGWL